VSSESSLWPEFEDDVDRGLGDLPEPAEAGVVAAREMLIDSLQTVRGAGYRFTAPP